MCDSASCDFRVAGSGQHGVPFFAQHFRPAPRLSSFAGSGRGPPWHPGWVFPWFPQSSNFPKPNPSNLNSRHKIARATFAKAKLAEDKCAKGDSLKLNFLKQQLITPNLLKLNLLQLALSKLQLVILNSLKLNLQMFFP